MRYQNNVFSILEKIKKNKTQKDIMNIKNLFLEEKKNINQLETLMNFQKEYLKKMNEEITLGISLHSLINYKNFISMLDEIIEKNLYFLKKNKNIIQEHLTHLAKSQMQLKTWIYLNTVNKNNILKTKKIKEQIINDNYAQLKFFNKDNHFNVRNNQ